MENFENISTEEQRRQEEERKLIPGYGEKTGIAARVIMILFGVILPIIAFLTNLYAIPFPVSFYSPELYLLLLTGFIGITVTALWNGPYPRAVALFTVHATFLGLVYSSIFSLVFIPLIPISCIAIIIYGMGILGFSPFLSLWAFIIAFRKSLNRGTVLYSKSTLIISCIIICIFLPLTYVGAKSTMIYINKKSIIHALECNIEEKPEALKSILKNPLLKTQLVNLYADNKDVPYENIADLLLNEKYISGEEISGLYYLLYGERLEVAERERLENIKLGFRNTMRFSEFVDFNEWSYVSLATCHYDGVINLDSNLSYQEITLDVESEYNRQEMVCEFKVPPGGVVTKLSLWINGEEQLAAITTKEKAETAYETIVSQAKDPALITWLGGNRYELRVFPVERDLPRKVKIGISAPLCPGEKGMTFIPIIFGDRNFKVTEKTITSAIIDIRAKNPDFKVTGLNEELDIYPIGEGKKRAEAKLSGFSSDALEILIERKEEEKLLSYESENFTYFQFSWYGKIEKEERKPVSVTYLLDNSYIMEKSGAFEEGKKAIINSVSNLKKGDEFNIIAVNFETKKLSHEPLFASKENTKKAKDFLKNLKPAGGLDIASVMEENFFPKNSSNAPVFLGIIHSSHPLLSDGHLCLNKSSRYPKGAISAGLILIDYKMNSFLSDLLEETGGKIIRVKDRANLESNFVRLEEFALNTDKIEVSCISDTENTPVPSGEITLRKTEPVFFYMRVAKDKTGGTMSILSDDKTVKELNLKRDVNKTSDDHIARLWAFNYIMEGHKKDLENKLTDEELSSLVTLGKDYYMVTPYTTLVVLESEEQYEQYEIDRNYEGEIEAPSIPEPESIFLIIVMIVFSLYIYSKLKKKKLYI